MGPYAGVAEDRRLSHRRGNHTRRFLKSLQKVADAETAVQFSRMALRNCDTAMHRMETKETATHDLFGRNACSAN